jgi:hypothetical protein
MRFELGCAHLSLDNAYKAAAKERLRQSETQALQI